MVDRLGLPVQAPTGHQNIYYAGRHLKTKRIGKVILPISLHFPDANRRTLNFTIALEVLDIPWDFLFGVEVLEIAYPDSELLDYACEVSPIATPPTDVCLTARNQPLITRMMKEDQDQTMHTLAAIGADFPTAPPPAADAPVTPSAQ
jgi:hypothetical protein